MHTVIMSLWQVEDQSAGNWMRALYEGRLKKKLNTAKPCNRPASASCVTAERRIRARIRSTGRGSPQQATGDKPSSTSSLSFTTPLELFHDSRSLNAAVRSMDQSKSNGWRGFAVPLVDGVQDLPSTLNQMLCSSRSIQRDQDDSNNFSFERWLRRPARDLPQRQHHRWRSPVPRQRIRRRQLEPRAFSATGSWRCRVPNGPATFNLSVTVENEKTLGEISSETMPEQAITDVAINKEEPGVELLVRLSGERGRCGCDVYARDRRQDGGSDLFCRRSYVMTGCATRRRTRQSKGGSDAPYRVWTQERFREHWRRRSRPAAEQELMMDGRLMRRLALSPLNVMLVLVLAAVAPQQAFGPPSGRQAAARPARPASPCRFRSTSSRCRTGSRSRCGPPSPLLHNPTNIDIDEDGRIWVAEGVRYRSHHARQPEGDRIVVLQDTDGDGKADSDAYVRAGARR